MVRVKPPFHLLLPRLHPPTAGDIIYNGQSIYNDLIGIRQKIGFCPQKPNFASGTHRARTFDVCRQIFLNGCRNN